MRQLVQTQTHEVQTESVDIPGTELRVSRVALGTWAMGGWMWGGTDERESVARFKPSSQRSISTPANTSVQFIREFEGGGCRRRVRVHAQHPLGAPRSPGLRPARRPHLLATPSTPVGSTRSAGKEHFF
jgi:hypothetical protein